MTSLCIEHAAEWEAKVASGRVGSQGPLNDTAVSSVTSWACKGHAASNPGICFVERPYV